MLEKHVKDGYLYRIENRVDFIRLEHNAVRALNRASGSTSNSKRNLYNALSHERGEDTLC